MDDKEYGNGAVRVGEGAEEILSFIGNELNMEGISLNDGQKNDIKRTFQKTRSHLFEYGILQEGQGYSFGQQPSPYEAVGTTQQALIPVMITIKPPDSYPSENYTTEPIQTPQDLITSPIQLRNSEGNLIDRQGNFDSVIVDRPEDTRIYTPEEIDQGSHLTTQVERYHNFQRNRGRVDADLDANSKEIVKNRRRVVDEYAQRSLEMRQARREENDEAFIRKQVEAIKELPPLIMYVNPEEFSISYNHTINAGSKGRDGYIIEHWGLSQPTISASGKIGATYIHTSNKMGQETGGLTQVDRRHSASYQSFMNLFKIYRNNSYIFNVHNRISVMGSIQLFYDGTIYTGSFDSFSISESETEPFNLNYDFDFTVRFQDSMSEISA